MGNTDKHKGPLGGECFFDADEDNEIQQKVKAQCAKEAAEEAEKSAKKKAPKE